MKVLVDLGSHYSPVTFEMDESDAMITLELDQDKTVMTVAEARLVRSALDSFIAQAERNERNGAE